MIVIKHRSASGRLDQLWDYDSGRRVIDVVMRLGSAEPLAFTVPVCAIDKPRLGAFALSRLDGESWRLLPSRFVLEGEKLVHQEVPIHSSLDRRTQLILSNAPALIDAEMEVLAL